MTACLNAAGLVLNLVGVILLFRYGMPYRASQINEGSLWADGPTANDKAANKLHSRMGWIGLALIVAGTGSQLWATLR